MVNPLFRHGPITFPVTKEVTPFRLVKLTDKGIEHAGAADTPIGVVTEPGKPRPNTYTGTISPGPAASVAVHVGGGVVVPIETTEQNLKMGQSVAVAADGKVSATGTVKVGTVVRTTGGTGSINTVGVLLNLPVA